MVQASAGPLEGLKERAVWSDADVSADALTAALKTSGVDEATLREWLDDNPKVDSAESITKRAARGAYPPSRMSLCICRHRSA